MTDKQRFEWIAGHLRSLLITIDDHAEIVWITDTGSEMTVKARPDTENPSDADLLRAAVDAAMQG